MKISECSFCGMLAITERDVCSSCVAFLPPEEAPPAAENAASPEMNPFQQPFPQTDPPPAFSEPPSNYAPQNFRNGDGYSNSHQSPPAMDARCIQCRTLIARGESRCFDCANKKASPFKRLAVLAVIFAVIGFFGFDYVYEWVSPHGIFRKYAKTTGADDSLVFENFVLTGETYVSVDSPASYTGAGFSDRSSTMETFSFKMVFKKPNISSVEFLRAGEAGKYTAFKQVFDGTRGWKYVNMPGQPAGYQDADDAFGAKKLGMGMDEYDTLEFLDDATAEVYGKDNIKALTDIKEVVVADITKTSAEKVVVVGKQKINGKIESSLLVFDQQTGLLLGLLKKGMLGSTPATTIIYLNKYAKFPVKRNGLFGVGETKVLVPTQMSFVTKAGGSAGQFNGAPVIRIVLETKNVETDAQIESNYFLK